MNVACPECASVFRVDPAKVPQAGVRARCSICGGIISIGRSGAIDEEFAAPAASPMATASVGQGAQVGGGVSTPPSGVPSWNAPSSRPAHVQSPPWGVPAMRPSPVSSPAIESEAPAAASSPSVEMPEEPAERGEVAATLRTPSPDMSLPAIATEPLAATLPDQTVEHQPAIMEADAAAVEIAPVEEVTPPSAVVEEPEPVAATASPPAPMPTPTAIEAVTPPVEASQEPTPSPTPAATAPPADASPPVSVSSAPTPVSSPTVRPRTATPPMGSQAQSAGTRGSSPVPPPTAVPPGPRSRTGSQPAVGDAPRPRPPINPFLANDPNQKAKRLARALVSDIVTYFPDKHKEGLRNGTLKDLFREEIKKSYEEYVDQMGRQFAESTTHFQDALNDVLSGGRKIF